MFNRHLKTYRAFLLWTTTLSLFLAFSSFTFASQDELDQIDHAIRSKGRHWLAKETQISRLPHQERVAHLGLIKSDAPQSAALSSPNISSSAIELAAPASFDWRDVGGYSYVTPVRDQGNCGSCWAFATTAALESNAMITTGDGTDRSEQILISCSGAGSCNGGYIDRASNYISNTGLPDESYYTYREINGTCGNALPGWQNDTSRITSWHYVANTTSPTVDQIKAELSTYGPLVTTMDVYTDFFYYGGGIYSYSYGSNEGGHAVLIVGYDDAEQYFVVKNSWESNWGESGYFKIAYSELNSVVNFGAWSIAYYTDTSAPVITVTAPNSSETWDAGSTKMIHWTYTGNPGSYVKIELYKAGVLNRTISTSVLTSSGSYSWVIPSTQTSGADYKVKVTSTTNSTYTDTSDNNFTILGPPPPSITVTSPNGGESWTAGTTHAIQWTYTGNPGSYVKIELYKAGVLNRTISTRILTSSGSYSWIIPSTQTSGADYKVKVTSTTNSTYTDTSDNNFTILGPLPPSITVTSPNGGESWTAGTTHAIQWTYTGNPGSSVKIELYKAGVLNRTISTSVLTSSGSYSWIIPSTQTSGADYKVKVTSTTNSTYTDTSDNNFTIVGPLPPSITVTSPNGGESWTAGTTHAIQWTYTGNPGSNVKIELYKAGVLNRTISTKGLTSSGSYSWVIPSTQTSGADYKVKVTSTTNSTYTDTSDSNFIIN